ncbi:MAG: hypothetical protein ACO3RV_03365, partial [Luteolibacter sp.]
SSGALDQTVPSDPLIGLLTNYHDYYKNLGRRSGTISPPSDGVAAKLPSRYTPIRRGELSPSTPLEPIMVPSIVRVDVIFSLISRDTHGGRVPALSSAGRRYMLHMLYLPVITLHNPYNVPLSVEGLKVTFKNVPVAFQFLVNRQPVTSQLVPLNQLYAGSEGGDSASKDFSCTLSGAIGSSSASSFVLEPGQTKLFGTPKVDPDWSWADEKAGQVGTDGIALFDWRNNQTSDFRMAPKLMTDPKTGAGFDIDWLAPRGLQTSVGSQYGMGEGIIALRGNELIGVNYAPYAPPAGGGKFDMEIELIQRGRASAVGGFSINYGDANRLTEIVETGTSLRFPTVREFPETFPKSPERPFRVTQIYEANNTAIKDYVRPKPFLIFSVGSRTTKESFTPTRVFADGNPVMNIAKVDLRPGKDPLGGAPLEMVMMPNRDGDAAIEDIRDTEEGFAFGGSGTLNGTPRATFYELPMGPLQSLAQFRHANLAGSGYMPHVTYTVGESRAHPQIGTSDIIGRWDSDNSTMLDHTWLSNEALWDSYFLSTIADLQGPAFGQTKGYAEVMKNFFNLSERLPNQRFRPYGTDSVPPEFITFPEEKIAAYLLLRGGFNVNSTSVEAWTAVLSALREREIETADGMDSAEPESTPMARVSRPSEKNIDRMAVNLVESRWQGYRSLTDDQISDLAENIVDQIRARGPFLSLADFVNRGVGPDGDEKNISGAIQAAIDALPELNQVMETDGITLDEGMLANHGYASSRAATQAGADNTASSAPGMITQGDVLTGLGSRITVRSDTFRIRAYGEARDNTGKKVQAKAWCEAIVQRVPDYVDPADDATAAPASLSDTNRSFGRRFEVVSFRWLDADEV